MGIRDAVWLRGDIAPARLPDASSASRAEFCATDGLGVQFVPHQSAGIDSAGSHLQAERLHHDRNQDDQLAAGKAEGRAEFAVDASVVGVVRSFGYRS